MMEWLLVVYMNMPVNLELNKMIKNDLKMDNINAIL